MPLMGQIIYPNGSLYAQALNSVLLRCCLYARVGEVRISGNGDGSLRYAAHLPKYLSVPTLVYRCVVQRYGKQIGIKGVRFGAHALRAAAATNDLDNGADIAKVQEWLGHANVSTTRIYDRRKMRPEEGPTFKVAY